MAIKSGDTDARLQLSRSLRITTDEPALPSAYEDEMTRLIELSNAFISKYAPSAPDSIWDQAIILISAYIYDQPATAEGRSYAYMFQNSGAEGLLSPWRNQIGGSPDVSFNIPEGIDIDPIVRAGIIGQDLTLTSASGVKYTLHLPVFTQASADLLNRAISDNQKSVDVEAITISDRDMSFISHDGTTALISVPGISVKKDGVLLGSSNEFTELNFKGTNINLNKVGNNVDITITPTIDANQVNTLIENNSKVVGLQEFEDALRKTTNLFNRSVSIRSGTLAQDLNVDVPTLATDREIIFSVGNESENFDLSALTNKPRVNVNDPLSSSNAVVFRTSNGNLHFLGRGNNNKLMYSSDTIGNYAVKVDQYDIDIDDWARRNSLQIPLSKLPSGIGSGGGDSTSIKALVSDWAEEGNTSQIPANKLLNASGPTGGLNSGQVAAIVQSSVSDWAETGVVDKIPDSKIRNNALLPAVGSGDTGLYLQAQENGSSDWVRTISVNDVERIARGEIASVDAIKDFKFMATSQVPPHSGTINGNIALTETFMIGATTYTISQIRQYQVGNSIEIFMTPVSDNNAADIFSGYKIKINDITLSFDDALANRNDSGFSFNGSTIIWQWDRESADIKVGENEVILFSPVNNFNFVPRGGDSGQVLTQTETGPEWKDSVGGGGTGGSGGLRSIYDGSGPGITFSSGTFRFGNQTLTTPGFDLDDFSTGIIFIEADVETNRQIHYSDNTPVGQDTINLKYFISVSDLKSLSNFDTGNITNFRRTGKLIRRLSLKNSNSDSSPRGYYEIRIGKNSAGNIVIGSYIRSTNSLGSNTITTDLNLYYLPIGGTGGGSTPSTPTPTERTLKGDLVGTWTAQRNISGARFLGRTDGIWAVPSDQQPTYGTADSNTSLSLPKVVSYPGYIICFEDSSGNEVSCGTHPWSYGPASSTSDASGFSRLLYHIGTSPSTSSARSTLIMVVQREFGGNVKDKIFFYSNSQTSVPQNSKVKVFKWAL